MELKVRRLKNKQIKIEAGVLSEKHGLRVEIEQHLREKFFVEVQRDLRCFLVDVSESHKVF